MAQLAFPLSFKRQLPTPLDADAVFATTAELNAYLSSALRYPGQVATCLETEGTVYVMSNDLSRWLPVSGGSSALPTLVAGQALSGHRVLATDSAGQAVYADQSDASALSAVGFSFGAVAPGALVSYVTSSALEYPPAALPPAADVAVVEASENLAAGDFVNIYDSTGTPMCRKADASTTGKEAHGFVLDAVTSGANATVYFEGTNDQITGATAGRVYLSAATAGGIGSTPPSTAGNIVQQLGVATAATSMNVELKQHYVLA